MGFDHLLENVAVTFLGRRGYIKAVPHPAQKGFIHQLIDIQIGGEYEQLLERDLNFSPCGGSG